MRFLDSDPPVIEPVDSVKKYLGVNSKKMITHIHIGRFVLCVISTYVVFDNYDTSLPKSRCSNY